MMLPAALKQVTKWLSIFGVFAAALHPTALARRVVRRHLRVSSRSLSGAKSAPGHRVGADCGTPGRDRSTRGVVRGGGRGRVRRTRDLVRQREAVSLSVRVGPEAERPAALTLAADSTSRRRFRMVIGRWRHES